MDQHSKKLTEEKALLYLLGQMNRHLSKTTSCEQSFNGLKITGMADRSKRLQLDDVDCYPLGILHIGKNRGLNLTPKANLAGPVALIDVDMRPWSFLTISSKTRSCMVPYFAPESKLDNHVPDYHVVVQPTFSEGPCNFPPLLCSSCKKNKDEAEEGRCQEGAPQVSTGLLNSTGSPDSAANPGPDQREKSVKGNVVGKDTFSPEEKEAGYHFAALEYESVDTSSPIKDAIKDQDGEHEASEEANTTRIIAPTDCNTELISDLVKLDGTAKITPNGNQEPVTTNNSSMASGVVSNEETPESEGSKTPGNDTVTEGREDPIQDSSAHTVIDSVETTNMPQFKDAEADVNGLDKAEEDNTSSIATTTDTIEEPALEDAPANTQVCTDGLTEDHQESTEPLSEDTNKTLNNSREITSLSILTATERTGSGIFYSEAVCVDIVNVSASGKNLVNWLKQCGIKAHPKNSQINRAKVLAFIDAILDRKVSPSEAFITSFTTKLLAESLDNELNRFGLVTKSKIPVAAKKKILTEFILKSHKTGEEATALTQDGNSVIPAINSEDEEPPPILSSDSSLSSSDVDSDSDSKKGITSDSEHIQKPNKAQKKTKIRNEQHRLYLKHDPCQGNARSEVPTRTKNKRSTKYSEKSKRSELGMIQNQENDTAKAAINSVAQNVGAISMEGPFRILENSLLTLEKRVTDQELIIENLTRKTSLSDPSPDTTQLQSKSIKSLEARTKVLSDTLNIQQNSLDNLVDRLTTCEKEKKRNKDQIAQVNSVLCQHKKESKESFIKLFREAEHADQKYSTVHGENLTLINSRVERIEEENNKFDEMFFTMKEELKGVQHLLQTLNGELSSLKANLNGITEGRYDSKGSRCHEVEHTQIVREIQEMKSDNRKFLEELTTRLLRGNTQLCDTVEPHNGGKKVASTQARHSQTLSTADENRLTTHEPAQKDKTHLQMSSLDDSESNTISSQTKANTEMQTGALVPKSDKVVRSTLSKSKDKSKSDTTRDAENRQPLNVEESRQRREEMETLNGPRESYRREPKSGNDGGGTQESGPPTASGSKSHLGNVTIDGSSQKANEGPNTRRAKFTTRKCMVIHDPYFKDFDKNKFSKWYDITTRRYDTLLQTKKDPALLTEIQKLSPAVVFLHIGQADILNQTHGDTVVANLTWLIEEILAKTPAKICVSLMIPLSCIPQVKSVIGQANREITNLITELRTTKRGSNRVFTQNNDVLGVFIKRSTNASGTVVSLSDRGQRKLWLHLRDGLSRALDQRPRHTSETSGSRSHNE